MGAAITTDQSVEVAPRSRARVTGVVYLLFFVTAVLGAYFTPATPPAILAHESAFWVGYTLTLTSTALYVALTALLYQLFWPVSRSFSLLAAFFGLIGCALQAFGSLFQLAPVLILQDEASSKLFTADQTQALAQLFLNLHAQANSISLVFFGTFLLLIGYLIFKATFLPRLLAVPIILAGVGWLTFLAPPLANQILTYIEVLGFLAEAALMLWLLVVGVNSERWKEQASASEASLHA
jgi:hypothetical protein